MKIIWFVVHALTFPRESGRDYTFIMGTPRPYLINQIFRYSGWYGQVNENRSTDTGDWGYILVFGKPAEIRVRLYRLTLNFTNRHLSSVGI